MAKDIYLTVTQVAQRLGISKPEAKEFIEKNRLTKYKACPGDTRYLVSMRELNRLLLSRKI